MKVKLTIVLGIIISLLFLLFPVISGESQSKIEIISANLSETKVLPGDTLTVTVEVRAANGIKEIVADIGGIETVSLDLVSGDVYSGTWQSNWRVHDTEVREYIVKLVVRDFVGNELTDSRLTFFDSPDVVGNLVAWWEFDEGSGQIANDSAADYDGVYNNGTLGGSTASDTKDPTWKSGSDCKFGNCLWFDGEDGLDHVYVPYSTSLNLSGKSATYTWWMNWTNATYIYQEVFYHTGTSGFVQWRNAGACNKYWQPYVSGCGEFPCIDSAYTPTNTWLFIAHVHNNTSQVDTVYINGTARATDSPCTSAGTDALYIGSDGTTTYDFPGFIDDFRIYDRALTSEEIVELYNSGPCIPPGTGNWNINSTCDIVNKNYTIYGNINVTSGGSLNLKGTTNLTFDTSASRYIYIYSGGNMTIKNTAKIN